jgi:IS5 family transposase
VKGAEDMSYQQSFTDMEYSNRKKKTKREEFLEMMDEIIPWDEWVSVIVPIYPSGRRGRPTRGIETMLRMYLLQNWFNLSDEGIEDAIYDSYAFRKFMKIDFFNEQVPDATTLCKFRKLLVDNGIQKLYFKAISDFLQEHGYMLKGGTIVDATIINASPSTKNAAKQRDPEMHQTKKGNQWHFGMKCHIGVDAFTGMVHTCEATAANVSDIEVAPKLLRKDDEVAYGDSAYSALHKRKEILEDENLSKIDFRMNTKKPYRKNVWQDGPAIYWRNYMEYRKSSVRSKVEYVFHIMKNIFGYKKVRYKGLEKNFAQQNLLLALANLYMLGKSDLLKKPRFAD